MLGGAPFRFLGAGFPLFPARSHHSPVVSNSKLANPSPNGLAASADRRNSGVTTKLPTPTAAVLIAVRRLIFMFLLQKNI